jgi:chromosomal replication initiator protein
MSNPTDVKLWDGMRSHLKRAAPDLCRQWFDEIEPLGVAGGAFHLRVQSTVHRDYLKRQCSDPFNDAAQAVSGRLLSVRFLGPDDHAAPGLNGVTPVARPAAGVSAELEPKPAPGSGPVGRREDALVINPDYTFEHFVEGPGNRLALAAAQAVAKIPGRSYNPLFIHGGVGLGKTHILQAICLRVLEHTPNADIYYLSCESFTTQFMEAVRSGEMIDFRHRFRDVDVLVVDDIHFLAKLDRSQEEFFHTFNSLYQAGKQLVLSSDAPPEDIPQLEERLVSRFKWGLVAKIEPPDYETRVAILRTKAALRGLTLPDDVAGFLAGEIDTNIRELEGAIVKLQILAAVDHAAVDMELARRAVGRSGAQVSQGPSIQTIIGVVCEFYRVKLTDLQSKRRQRSIAVPRQVCMSLARKFTSHSLEEIGGFFGGRDHTTVMHALRTVDERRAEDPEFDAAFKRFEESLRSDRIPGQR